MFNMLVHAFLLHQISYENITAMSFLGNRESPFPLGSTATTTTIEDLTPHTNYTVSVRACTKVGCGDSTTNFTFTSQDGL